MNSHDLAPVVGLVAMGLVLAVVAALALKETYAFSSSDCASFGVGWEFYTVMGSDAVCVGPEGELRVLIER